MENPRLVLLVRIWAGFDLAFFVVLFAGGIAAAAGSRVGAYLLFTYVFGEIGGHLLVGTAAYRAVMRADWPQVAPLADDEWED